MPTHAPFGGNIWKALSVMKTLVLQRQSPLFSEGFLEVLSDMPSEEQPPKCNSKVN